MKIAISGATGLVGSRLFDLLKNNYDIVPLSSSYGIDITDMKKVDKFLKKSNPALIIHLAAKTNVDACEEDKDKDIKMLGGLVENGEIDINSLDADKWKGSKSAFGINVIGTKNLADYASGRGIKIIYMSTDFVFDGSSDVPYSEEDVTSPINWYGQTKFWGEKVITGDKIIARISYPYGYQSSIKKDIVWTLVDLLSKGSPVKLITDQIITPTFIDDIVKAIKFLIEKNEAGLFNVVGNNFMSPYEIGIALCRERGYAEGNIIPETRAVLYKNRAPRPFKVQLKNDKLGALGFKMTDFFEALKMINNSHPNL